MSHQFSFIIHSLITSLFRPKLRADNKYDEKIKTAKVTVDLLESKLLAFINLFIPSNPLQSCMINRTCALFASACRQLLLLLLLGSFQEFPIHKACLPARLPACMAPSPEGGGRERRREGRGREMRHPFFTWLHSVQRRWRRDHAVETSGECQV